MPEKNFVLRNFLRLSPGSCSWGTQHLRTFPAKKESFWNYSTYFKKHPGCSFLIKCTQAGSLGTCLIAQRDGRVGEAAVPCHADLDADRLRQEMLHPVRDLGHHHCEADA